MRTKRSLEGYLLIDNSHAPGVSEAMARASGKSVMGAGINGKYEAGILTCSHCQVQMPVNPLRTRERGYCRKCDHYLCDTCNAVAARTGECGSLKARLFELRETILRSNAHGSLER